MAACSSYWGLLFTLICIGGVDKVKGVNIHIGILAPISATIPLDVITDWSNTTFYDVTATTSVHCYDVTSIVQLKSDVLDICNTTSMYLSVDGCDTKIAGLYGSISNPILQVLPDVTCSADVTYPNVIPMPAVTPLPDVVSHLILTRTDINKIVIFYTQTMADFFFAVENMLHKSMVTTEDYLVGPLTTPMQLNQMINSSLILDSITFNNYVVLCDGDQAAEILKQANLLESGKWISERTMVYSRWLFITTDPADIAVIEAQLTGVTNVAALYLDTGTNRDKNIRWALDALSLALNDTAFELSPSMHKPSCTTTVQQTTLINKLRFRIDNSSGISSHCGPYTLYSAQWEGGDMRLIQNPFCQYGDSGLKEMVKTNAFPNEDMEYGNRTFKIGILSYTPFLSESPPVNGSGKVYWGMCIDLLNDLATSLNFSYELIEPADGQWGVEDPVTGQWTGLVGVMQNKEVDMVIAPLFMTDDRLQVMDFTTPYLYETTGVIFKPPGENEGKWRTVIEPFRWHVWITLFACIFFTGLVAWGMTRISYKLLKVAVDQVDDMFKHLQQASWYVFGAILTQGGAFEPQTIAVRVVIGSWWLVCIILVGTYSGNLIAFLTISKSLAPFTTVDEILSQGRYTWGTQGGTAYHSTLSVSKDPVLEEVYKGIKKFEEKDPDVLSTSFNKHIEKIEDRNYVLITDITAGTMEQQNDCEKMVIRMEEFPVYAVAIGLQKNSSLKAKLDKKISWLRESGMVAFWKQKYWPVNRCEGISIANAQPVDLLDTQSAFYVLSGGLFLALVILVGEKVHMASKSKKITKVRPISPEEYGGDVKDETPPPILSQPQKNNNNIAGLESQDNGLTPVTA